ncbi:MAG: DUF2493 domain-containing protein [Lachnospiraceae bacterium]|nr:DUF2493 domain-containing protein [Lachnospiraceae bacterium]
MAKYRMIVAGSRTFDDYPTMKMVLDDIMKLVLWDKDDSVEIVSGHAEGADKMGERYATESGYECQIFPAKWDLYGKKAGFIRNEEMARYATETGYKGVLVAFYGGNKSGGTKNMIDYAHRYEMYTYVVDYKDGHIRDKAWEFSKKQDDEYGMYSASKRHVMSLLNSDGPTGICLIALLKGCGCCEDGENIYCYDKCQPCMQRQQLHSINDTYEFYHDDVLNGDVAAATMKHLDNLRAGRIKEETIKSAIDELLQTTNCSDEDLARERASILSALLTEE